MRPRHALSLVLVLVTASLLAGPADARARLPRSASAFATTSVAVPPEWAGVWSYVDSTYSCGGELLGVDGGLDTLCAGQTYLTDVGGSGFTLTCDGTATATTVDVTCTGGGELFPDCVYTLTSEVDGVRTGDSYVVTNVLNTSYVGTGEGCEFLPGDCTRTVTRADRIGPAPSEYCTTPVTPTTWGQVKVRYR